MVKAVSDSMGDTGYPTLLLFSLKLRYIIQQVDNVTPFLIKQTISRAVGHLF